MKRLAVAVLVVAAAGVAVWLVTRPKGGTGPSEELRPTPGLSWFEDVTVAAGIEFAHFDPATPDHFIEETVPGGIGWIDYDSDGRPDLVCVQAGPVRPAGAPGPPTKLYRNNGDGTFTDVSAASGLTRTGVGVGCAVGDYDNDGFDDLLVTYVGAVVLYHNVPDGHGGRRFEDVSAAAGVSDPHFATSAAWGDVDGDGFLDLYVCNYVELSRVNDPVCQDPSGHTKIGCAPTAYPYAAHKLFRNRGDGTFEDVTQSSGVGKAKPAPGFGVVMVDVDGDGKLDIYVVNDLNPAYLFHNLGGGKFEEIAGFAGCAYDAGGGVMAGMGVTAGDAYRDGRPAFLVTNYQNLPNVLFQNRGDRTFRADPQASGLGPPSLNRLGFGVVFFDGDLDGNLDVVAANGHVIRPAQDLFGCPYPQEAQFFRGLGPGRFEDVSDRAGRYFRERYVGRGLAVADFDGDGQPDLAFGNCGGPYRLLRNATATANRGVTLDLIGDGVKSNRNAVGARVVVEAGGKRQTSWVLGGGSYVAASERRQVFGLGAAERAERVTITWPSGRVQELKDVAAGRWRVVEGAVPVPLK